MTTLVPDSATNGAMAGASPASFALADGSIALEASLDVTVVPAIASSMVFAQVVGELDGAVTVIPLVQGQTSIGLVQGIGGDVVVTGAVGSATRYTRKKVMDVTIDIVVDGGQGQLPFLRINGDVQVQPLINASFLYSKFRIGSIQANILVNAVLSASLTPRFSIDPTPQQPTGGIGASPSIPPAGSITPSNIAAGGGIGAT